MTVNTASTECTANFDLAVCMFDHDRAHMRYKARAPLGTDRASYCFLRIIKTSQSEVVQRTAEQNAVADLWSMQEIER